MHPLTSGFCLSLSIWLLTGCTHNAAVTTIMPVSEVLQTPPSAQCRQNLTNPHINCAHTVSATFDNKGILWIVWSNGEYVFVQSSNDAGQHFSAPVAVNTTAEQIAADGESRPKIKTDAQGRIYVSWVQTLDQKRSTYVRFSYSADRGKHFAPVVTINDNLEVIRHRFDSLAIGKNGEIFIAWLDARHTEAANKAGQEFNGLSLYYTWSNDGGEHFYPNQKIADHTCECCRLDSGIAKDNTPVIIWRQIFDGGIRDHALVKFKDWQTPEPLRHLGQENWKIDACPHHGPGLAIADDGTYHAVWFSNSDSKQGLFYAYSKDEGKTFSPQFNVGKLGASHPHIASLGQQVVIAWQAFDGKQYLVQVIRSLNGGKQWSKPQTVVESVQKIDQPFLISNKQNIYLSLQIPDQGYQLKPLLNK